MHTATITRPDRAALENLWGDAGIWVADTWTEHNRAHFSGRLRYHGVVWGLTPHGAQPWAHVQPRRAHHPAPGATRPTRRRLGIEGTPRRLGMRYASDVLLHEMVHVALFARRCRQRRTAPAPQHRASGAPRSTESHRHSVCPRSRPPGETAASRRQGASGAHSTGTCRGTPSHRWPHTIRPTAYYYAPDIERIRVQSDCVTCSFVLQIPLADHREPGFHTLKHATLEVPGRRPDRRCRGHM